MEQSPEFADTLLTLQTDVSIDSIGMYSQFINQFQSTLFTQERKNSSYIFNINPGYGAKPDTGLRICQTQDLCRMHDKRGICLRIDTVFWMIGFIPYFPGFYSSFQFLD